jgi:hypothetical protein
MGAAAEPLVWCKCQDAGRPCLTTKDKCLGPDCNGVIIGDVVLAVRVRDKFKKKKKKKK